MFSNELNETLFVCLSVCGLTKTFDPFINDEFFFGNDFFVVLFLFFLGKIYWKIGKKLNLKKTNLINRRKNIKCHHSCQHNPSKQKKKTFMDDHYQNSRKNKRRKTETFIFRISHYHHHLAMMMMMIIR